MEYLRAKSLERCSFHWIPFCPLLRKEGGTDSGGQLAASALLSTVAPAAESDPEDMQFLGIKLYDRLSHGRLHTEPHNPWESPT